VLILEFGHYSPGVSLMPKLDRPNSPLSSQPIGPIAILNQAINRVPALKYALGLAGIAAAIAIIRTLVTDLRLAAFGIVVMVVLMTVLFVFAKLSAIGPREVRLPALALMWFSLLLTITSASLLFTSVFFDWPLSLKHIVDRQATAETKISDADKKTYLRGVVRDLNTKEGIADAVLEMELLPGKTFRTSSDGGFSIEDIPAAAGENARVFVRKDGYGRRDEYVTLPGPKSFYLESQK
jgi:hypothetical protein